MLLPEYPRGSVGKENAVLTTGILPDCFRRPTEEKSTELGVGLRRGTRSR